MFNSIIICTHNLIIIGVLLFLWHSFLMVLMHNTLTNEFIDTNSDMCTCGMNIYKNIYYICSNDPLKNYMNYFFSFNYMINQNDWIPQEYDPYSLIFPATIKWGKFRCIRSHI